MIYPQVSVEEWCRRYGMDNDPCECKKCGKMQTYTTPVAHGEMRGLITNHLECGKEYQRSCWVSTDEKWNDAVKDLFETLMPTDTSSGGQK